ncbi:MAG TPA: prolipoprotein diacylglyceryl transferase [Bacilli bacterium]|nr:MAG: Prolipoprotein diacylglyceryl transferase [Tenericutes bacterium ADurb.BinA124]HPN60752.1 prolipoprotein diacylglyceryl transferase [Bacilli bacterium]HPX84092.1 prolipoprotein diacylglyceryl transferase [Bacilli bacterium]HQC74334.1 prolipoprotein diacylglyceryl transferase [Bacilli bacterium]
MYPEIFVKMNEFLEPIGLDTFVLFIGIGLVFLLNFVINGFEKELGFSRQKTNRLLLLFGIGLAVTYGFALFFDALFHYFEDGEFSGGITYIAGFMGGVICFTLLVYFFVKEERPNILKILNVVVPGILLAHGFGRLGCFSVGCCYGKATNSFLGVLFPEGTNPYADGIRTPIHPTQLYEAFFLFLMFFILNFYKKGARFRFAIYLISYGVFRFFLEIFLRGDNRGSLFGVAPSAILSAVMFLAGITLLIIQLRKGKDLAA